MTEAIAKNLFEDTPDGPRLIGGKHKNTGKITFPLPSGAEGAHYDAITLSPTGSLWSWSVQRFLPKSPPYMGTETLENFQPYAFGYVELPGEIIVETRLTQVDTEALEIGQPMALTLIDFAHKERGQLKTYAFCPVEA